MQSAKGHIKGSQVRISQWSCPHRRHKHCVVSLSKTLYPLLSTGSTQEDLSLYNWKIVDWNIKSQTKQKNEADIQSLKIILIQENSADPDESI